MAEATLPLPGNDKILIVDDDQDYLALVARYATSLGLDFIALADSVAALEYVDSGLFGIVISDMVMPEVDGMQLLHHIKTVMPSTDVIIMTGYSKKYSYTEVIGRGASDFIEKPFKRDEFTAKLNRLRQERYLIQELRQAQQKAEIASQAKTNFLNAISHEFRTPMNGIIGFTYLLNRTELTPVQKEHLGMISKSSERLQHLIDQIFDFSMLDGSVADLHPAHFEISSCLGELQTRHQKKLQEKNLQLRIALEDELPAKLWFGDQTVICQLFNILIDNAIKYTTEGEIILGGRVLEKKTGNKYLLHFTVKDSGCGIAPEKKELIFQPFAQAEEYLTRLHEGAGLDLAICAKLVNLMGGKIWVESTAGQGSTFHLTLEANLA